MQNELLTANPATAIRILGINEIGEESGNGTITTGRTIPWLQDDITPSGDVWFRWGASKDHVFILDRQNRKVRVYNLITHDLTNPTYYNELKSLLLQTAGE
jgi:hypothetical protein